MSETVIPISRQCEDSEIQYGACRYCGQMFQIETLTGICSDETLDDTATAKCGCPEAEQEQHAKRRRERATKAISELFQEDEPEAETLLLSGLEHVLTGKIGSVQVQSTSGVKGKISENAKGNIKVERNVSQKTIRES